jgi:hypothetical protein
MSSEREREKRGEAPGSESITSTYLKDNDTSSLHPHLFCTLPLTFSPSFLPFVPIIPPTIRLIPIYSTLTKTFFLSGLLALFLFVDLVPLGHYTRRSSLIDEVCVEGRKDRLAPSTPLWRVRSFIC